ncbi:ATP-binding protein [Streptomyces armeniacus]|uniref:ATP-binding protein n=1 Tax=Streptomyces armeniacus TaxID=83291 RepID=A0A345XNB7_9ACTN|nr:ATP-binding protein [Streptomyces armeniacus]AXK33133.1 ATP-binding protein [Streptomyces armeniacus]
MDIETQLPRHRERFFRRERRSVPVAREFTRRALTDWGSTERADEVLLCVSELATNALLHGVPPGRGYRLHLWLDCGGLIRVEVHDSGDGHPRARTGVAEEAEGGRGLRLVELFADKWGVGGRNPGKVVWCEFG